MKEKILSLRCYNLLNENGRTLRMYLGRYENHREAVTHFDKDQGYRWMFEGTQIPMPVRSGTWFNGFPESIMLDWLKGNGWALRASVDMTTGKATVYELPFVDEPSKGNENTIIASDIQKYDIYADDFKDALCGLVMSGKRINAVRVYRYAHGGTLKDATNAVKEICGLAWY